MKFFTSDLHFRHPFVAALRGYARNPEQDPESIREYAKANDLNLLDIVNWRQHDKDMLDALNEFVHEDDELYVLGDISSGGRASLDSALDSLSHLRVARKNRHLILGNHENLHPNAPYIERLLTVFSSVSLHDIVTIQGRNFAMSHFQFEYHFDGNGGDGMSTNANGLQFKKYAIADDGHTLLLHGHTHASSPLEFDNPRELNVGVDAWSMRDAGDEWAMRPLSEDTIMQMVHDGKFSLDDRR